MYVPLFPSQDKVEVAEETGNAGPEMTEEEWTRRVAELNKHQVSTDCSRTSADKNKHPTAQPHSLHFNHYLGPCIGNT